MQYFACSKTTRTTEAYYELRAFVGWQCCLIAALTNKIAFQSNVYVTVEYYGYRVKVKVKIKVTGAKMSNDRIRTFDWKAAVVCQILFQVYTVSLPPKKEINCIRYVTLINSNALLQFSASSIVEVYSKTNNTAIAHLAYLVLLLYFAKLNPR